MRVLPGLSEDQERVAHGRGAKPLLACEAVLAIRAGGFRARGVGPHVGAALPLGHRHAEEHALLGRMRLQAGVVLEGRHERLPLRRELGRLAKRGHRRVGHRHRAAVATLDLRPDVEGRSAGRMRARTRFAPRQRVQAMAHRDLHQLVPRGMKLDLVDALAEPVVSAEPRRVGVGLEAPVDRLLRAGQPSELVHEVVRPRGALTLERFPQRCVGFEEVVADERRWLVGAQGRSFPRASAARRLARARTRRFTLRIVSPTARSFPAAAKMRFAT